MTATLAERLAAAHFGPGWDKPTPSLWPSPRLDRLPHVWRFEEARAELLCAGARVSTELSERRNLIMVNPSEGNEYATTRTLVAAYQLVLPGERARSHRHSPNALRIVLDAPPGTFTVVDGVRIDMAPGDVVLTPNGCWHGHRGGRDGPSIWIDVLDVPFVQQIGAMFFEPYPTGHQLVTENDPHSPLRIRASSIVGTRGGNHDLVTMTDIGGGIIPTIGITSLVMARGGTLRDRCTTADHLYCVLEGRCTAEIEEYGPVTWGRGDLLAVPSWHRHTMVAATDAVVVDVSDEPLLRSAGLLRSS